MKLNKIISFIKLDEFENFYSSIYITRGVSSRLDKEKTHRSSSFDMGIVTVSSGCGGWPRKLIQLKHSRWDEFGFRVDEEDGPEDSSSKLLSIPFQESPK